MGGVAELISYLIIILGVRLTVIYRLRFILLAIWGPTINPSSNVVSETDNYLYARTLFLPRALSGKFLFFGLSAYLPSVFISARAKVATVGALLLPCLLLLKISNQRPFVRKKFFRFI